MDPNACRDRIFEMLAGYEFDGAIDALRDLSQWLHMGGFAPEYTSEAQASLFQNLVPATTVHALFSALAQTLSTLSPEAHQQLFTPAVGFIVEPIRAALEADRPSDSWWQSLQAMEALRVVWDAVEEALCAG